MADLVLYLCASIADSVAVLNLHYFICNFRGAFLGRKVGMMPQKNTGMLHINQKRTKNQSGVPGQILMVSDMKKVIFNPKKCLAFLRSKG